MDKAFEPVRAPARVLQVIYEIALSSNGLSLARLVALTGLPKTSLLSLLRSLEASNYVVNVAGAYRLGQETLNVAAAITGKQRFLPAARPTLEALFNETGETVQLSVLAADEPAAESVDVIETRKPIRLSFPVGLRRPLYCSSIGKLLLAHQPESWVDDYLAKTQLIAYTPQTITNEAVLRAELAQIRRSGLSVSHHGMFEDSSGMSAAVWNDAGHMLGGVSLVAPTYRMTRDEARFKRLVLAAGEDVSRRLGYKGPYPVPVEAAVDGEPISDCRLGA
jgi:IclR family transcriptional regulator, acetate operon repressor